MPALSMALGYVIAHPDMTAREFFTYGGNFYTTVGMCLTIYMLYRGSRKRGHKFFEDATCYLDRVELKKSLGFFVFGISAAVACSSVLTLLPRWKAVADYSEASQVMFRGRDILFTVITTVIVGPLVEEIVFRGYMLNIFLESMEEKWAVGAASLFFALCHGEALWILYAFVMGLVLCRVSIEEDNIFYGIMVHIGFNLPSAITWLISSVPALSQGFYRGKLLIAGYGLVGGLMSLLLARAYRKKRTEG